MGNTGASDQPPTGATIEIVVSARDQFIAFACGCLVARTRPPASAARLLGEWPPSLVAEFGRAWVTRPCREVVSSVVVDTSVPPYDPGRVAYYRQCHVWMCLSPTLGVVRSMRVSTYGPGMQFLIGHIGGCKVPKEATTATTEVKTKIKGAATTEETHVRSTGSQKHQSCCGDSGGDRIVVLGRKPMMNMDMWVDVVDQSGFVVENLHPGNGGATGDEPGGGIYDAQCNWRWLVLIGTEKSVLWRIDEARGALEGGVTIALGSSPPLSVRLSDSQVNVLFVQVFDGSDKSKNYLERIDLEQSFNKRMAVALGERVPLPANHILKLGGHHPCTVSWGAAETHTMFNTKTRESRSFQGGLFPLGDNAFAIQSAANHERSVPGTMGDGGSISAVRLATWQVSTHIAGGIIVWECEGGGQTVDKPKRGAMTKKRFMITDAVTDTLLAFLNCKDPL
ncbi:hypothetical protein Pelo_15846 [Pelomyxa schiedti]|nr:hypothetical protein Pelo_15846 [Pelomyxa schiedti]